MNQTPPPIKNDDEKANLLCIISIGLLVLRPIINGIFNILYSHSSTINDFLLTIRSFLSNGCGIAALVLLIIVRVNYPNNKFGKILMWIYIVLFIISIVVIFISVVACGIALGSCIESMQGCGSMG